MPAPQVSVILPVRDGGALLGEQLRALAAQDHPGPWELLVSDNGSTDGAAAAGVAAWPRGDVAVRLVDASARSGPGAARNLAARAAAPSSTGLVFCDADDQVQPGWLAGLVQALDDRPLVTGPVVLVDGRGFERARSTKVPVWFGRFPYALGASLGIRRSVFEQLGGFADTPPGVSAGDVELAWRAGQAGHRIGFAVDARVVKRRRQDLRATWHQWFGYGRGARWIARRHGRGLGASCVRLQVRTLAWLVVHPGQLGRPEGRRRWVCWAAQACGFVRGPGRVQLDR